MYRSGKVYCVYLITNSNKSTLYTGVTNNLKARIIEHWNNRGNPKSFAGRYHCYNLVYYETFQYILDAIAREKEIKKWNRTKKENLIRTKNPNWKFMNESIYGEWPPTKQLSFRM